MKRVSRVREVVAALVGFVLVLAPVAAQPNPEERVLGFAEALNSGDEARFAQFLRDNMAVDWPEERFRGIATMVMSDLGRIEVLGIDQYGSERIVLEARKEDGDVIGIGFGVGPAPERRLVGISLEMGGGEADSAPELPALDVAKGLSETQTKARLEAYLQDLAARDLFAGSVLIAREGNVVFESAQGLASRSFGVPNELSTRFNLGSINKAFTKVAIAQLLAAGKLGADDLLAVHLPDYPNRDVAGRITIGQLVDHTSGLGDIFTDAYAEGSKARFRDPQDYFELFAEQPLLFEPGEGRQYSNAGYIVLGAVIERLTGMPYAEYVAANVFAPAGMETAGFPALDEPAPNLAEGYTRHGMRGELQEGTLKSNVFMLPVVGNAAGSAYATARDLFRFDNALREGKLLPAGYLDWFFGGPVPQPGAAAAGSGGSDVGMGVAGGGPGVHAVLESDGSTTIIVLANMDPPVAGQVARQLGRAFDQAR